MCTKKAKPNVNRRPIWPITPLPAAYRSSSSPSPPRQHHHHQRLHNSDAHGLQLRGTWCMEIATRNRPIRHDFCSCLRSHVRGYARGKMVEAHTGGCRLTDRLRSHGANPSEDHDLFTWSPADQDSDYGECGCHYPAQCRTTGFVLCFYEEAGVREGFNATCALRGGSARTSSRGRCQGAPPLGLSCHKGGTPPPSPSHTQTLSNSTPTNNRYTNGRFLGDRRPRRRSGQVTPTPPCSVGEMAPTPS
mmetsp:Transcript_17583/g.41272  ORF Transcript_17583/g.41272 Transcript_17583/m.41272 type:complete len:247 (-) Transcript_17583:201-941(-)